MRLRLRQFELRALTVEGTFGVSLLLAPGLVVIRGDNSSGKSTCLQGIVYALGLEGMLSPSRVVPLPHVATSSLTDETTGRELDVLESYVTLEFENEIGQIATVRRYAKHSSIDTQLVSVWEGAALTGHRRDLREHAYFVRRPGAFQREAGFHHWLAQFVGWQLPEVARYDEGTSPLYLETIFPLFFVEQKRGWAGIQAETPTYFRIRDVGRRNVEFVLALSSGDVAAERQLVRERMNTVRQRWQTAIATFRTVANDEGIAVRGIPEDPVGDWPTEPGPSLWLAAESAWFPVDSELQHLNEALAELTGRVLPRTAETEPAVSGELQQHLRDLHELSELVDSLHREMAIEEDQQRSLDSRIKALGEDIRRSQDAEALRRMGAVMDAIMPSDCPTCHQELPSTLLDPAAGIVPMPIEGNVRLLREQIELFDAMRRDLDSTVVAKRRQLAVLEDQARSLQQSVRAERETLVSAIGSVSIEEVERRVHLRDRIERLDLVVSRFSGLNAALSSLAKTWTGLLQERRHLQDQAVPENDTTKLSAFQTSFLTQLDEYAFTSLPLGELAISQDTYLPVYEGVDLGFDLSASDMVRTIWAHRLGLLEVARSFQNNHAQLLVFDEPRQQSTDHLSFTALFRRASQAAASGQQIIFATSEPEDAVLEMLADVPHDYIGFAGKLIQRI